MPERLFPNRLDRNDPVGVVVSIPVPPEEASRVIVLSGSGSEAVLVARSVSSFMKPESSLRFAIIAPIAGIAALKARETADSDSLVCRVRIERIAGEASSRKLSNMDAIESSRAYTGCAY